jgi:hypothetical protein
LLWIFLVVSAFRYGKAEGFFAITAILSGWLSIPFLIFVNEFGHAVAGRLTGHTLIECSVGSGPTIAVFRWGDAPVRFRRYLFNGGRTKVIDLLGTHIRVRRAMLLIGGPAANALLCVCICLAMGWAFGDTGSGASLAIGVPSGVAAFSGIFAIASLIPRTRMDEAIGSDGRQLLGLLRSREKDAGAVRFVQASGLIEIGRLEQAAKLLREGPLDGKYRFWLLTSAMSALYRTEGPRAALDYYLQRRGELAAIPADADQVVRSGAAWAKSSVAGCAMELEGEQAAEMAETLSAEAVAELPGDVLIKSVRGAWLVRHGRIEEGIGLLTNSIRAAPVTKYRDETCAELARAWRTLGDEARARGYEALREHVATTI